MAVISYVCICNIITSISTSIFISIITSIVITNTTIVLLLLQLSVVAEAALFDSISYFRVSRSFVIRS